MPGLTAAKGTSLAEAAGVCLKTMNHQSGTSFTIAGRFPQTVNLLWSKVTEQQERSNADMQDATEDGAAGVAILAMKTIKGLSVHERAVKGTGVDYWLGTDAEDDDALPFQNLTRLEVSGILSGTAKQVAQRVKLKLAQCGPTDHICPAYIAVVEFGSPIMHLEEK